MGIPKFYSQWLAPLSKTTDGVGILQPLPTDVASLSIDLNSILHEEAAINFGYGAYAGTVTGKQDPTRLMSNYLLRVSNRIMNLVAKVRPTDLLVVAIDGVVPVAKMNQQRWRRARSAMEKSLDNIFDSNAITPGTDFMLKLDAYLQDFFADPINQNRLPQTVVYSSQRVVGEGEHKIMDLMRQGLYPPGGHVIYGLDMDLIVLSLVSPVKGICLYREDQKETINIDNIANYLISRLGETGPMDFALMSFFVGNDFLPAQPAFANLGKSLNLMIDTLSKMGLPLVDANGIIWANLRKFAQELSAEESHLLREESQIMYRYPSDLYEYAIQDRYFNYGRFRDAWYTWALGLDETVVNPQDDINNMITNYIAMLDWIYRYYTLGLSAVDYYFYYHYYATPLLSDIVEIEDWTNDFAINNDDSKPVDLLELLVTVTPRNSGALLPDYVRKIHYQKDVRDMYPGRVEVDRKAVNDEWQGVVIMPDFDINTIVQELRNLVDKGGYRDEQYEYRYTNVDEPLVYERDEESYQCYLEQEQNKERINEMLRQDIRESQRGRGRGRGGSDRGRGRGAGDRGRGAGGYRGRGGSNRGRGGYRGRGAPRRDYPD